MTHLLCFLFGHNWNRAAILAVIMTIIILAQITVVEGCSAQGWHESQMIDRMSGQYKAAKP